MGLYQREERVRVKVAMIVQEEKQGHGYINFITDEKQKRFADFITENYDAEKDVWEGKRSEVFEALDKAFQENKWITLILVRVNSEHDSILKTESCSQM